MVNQIILIICSSSDFWFKTDTHKVVFIKWRLKAFKAECF
jgi:hypothetical protein